VHVNSPLKFGPKPHMSATFFFSFIFAMSSCLICFDRDRTSRLRYVVTIGRSSL
jgi:hypothetical protein